MNKSDTFCEISSIKIGFSGNPGIKSTLSP